MRSSLEKKAIPGGPIRSKSCPAVFAFLPLLIAGFLMSDLVSASELVYTPVNPTFGGNPGNGPNLLNMANAQNDTSAPQLTAIQKFNQSLQQAILTKLSNEAVITIFGSSSTLKPGHYDTGTYSVDIVSDGTSLTVTTTDKSSGATSVFVVSNPGQL